MSGSWNAGQGPLTYQQGGPLDQFAQSQSTPIRPYQAQNELDRLRLGVEDFSSSFSSSGQIGVGGGPSSFVSYGPQQQALQLSAGQYSGISGGSAREYSTTTEPSQAAQNAYDALQYGDIGGSSSSSSLLQSRHASYPQQQQQYTQGSSSYQQQGGNGNNNSNLSGTSYTQVNGDPQTHTVTLSTTTYQPNGGGNLVEAVDTYTYRRPETTNGEYGNFPRRGHSEHVVGNAGSQGGNGNVFANGGKIVKNGDKVVPLGGPG
ncbi:hypothetical protein HKX48_008800 [Thoreauomyces humboldtii]|nr:hypothetical protein HKX48_008800 [Thoreauomyces humboldtii]